MTSARVPHLMLELTGGIGRVGRRTDSTLTVYGPHDEACIDLDPYQQSYHQSHQWGHTVFRENIAATLSHSVPLLGAQPNSLPMPEARRSTRSFACSGVYFLPVKPHVKKGRDLAKGCRPWLSEKMNSGIETFQGGSDGSFGTHEGA